MAAFMVSMIGMRFLHWRVVCNSWRKLVMDEETYFCKTCKCWRGRADFYWKNGRRAKLSCRPCERARVKAAAAKRERVPVPVVHPLGEPQKIFREWGRVRAFV